MKFSELKDQTLPELAVKSRDLRQQLFKLQLQRAASQLENTSQLRNLRRDIARVETRMSALRKQTA
ncbi:MAG: 50S ribosomal protein L29 [Verrucomicrobia bacterium]|nr:50S ribosomal protein L29 [Verrucomicrobiota bacterium]MBI3869467.1 50S ribosomal protein L29 [Verrucomicrobiota bacterium]